jgi:hypothetical protein
MVDLKVKLMVDQKEKKLVMMKVELMDNTMVDSLAVQ